MLLARSSLHAQSHLRSWNIPCLLRPNKIPIFAMLPATLAPPLLRFLFSAVFSYCLSFSPLLLACSPKRQSPPFLPPTSTQLDLQPTRPPQSDSSLPKQSLFAPEFGPPALGFGASATESQRAGTPVPAATAALLGSTAAPRGAIAVPLGARKTHRCCRWQGCRERNKSRRKILRERESVEVTARV
uniref:Uncharacterized protein n=1 Tax=Rhizophora mucronata TaxID=61149 RepID=A0A2P2L251_RHIMU